MDLEPIPMQDRVVENQYTNLKRSQQGIVRVLLISTMTRKAEPSLPMSARILLRSKFPWSAPLALKHFERNLTPLFLVSANNDVTHLLHVFSELSAPVSPTHEFPESCSNESDSSQNQ